MMNLVGSKSNISGWSLDKGYDDQVRNGKYPIRAFGSKKNSLRVTINVNSSNNPFPPHKLNLAYVYAQLPNEMTQLKNSVGYIGKIILSRAFGA